MEKAVNEHKWTNDFWFIRYVNSGQASYQEA